MRVLLVNVTLGSMGNITLQLAKNMLEEGVRPVMLTYNAPLQNIDGIKFYNFNWITPSYRLIGHYLSRKTILLDLLFRIIAVSKKEHIDLVHAFFAYPTGVATTFFKKLKGIPSIITVAGSGIEVVEDIQYGDRLDTVENTLIRFALRTTDHVIAPSSYSAQCAQHAGADIRKLSIIPFGIDLETFDRIADNTRVEDAKIMLGITNDTPVVLALCRLHPKKGLNYLISCFPKVLKACPDAKLIITGKGSEENRLKTMIHQLRLSKNVIFTGFVSQELKYSLLKLADVYVLPSLSDTFPISVLEAMACKTPIIMTNKVGISDFFNNRKFGIEIKPRDPQGLTDAIIRILCNKSLQLHFGKEARTQVEELNYHRIAKETLCLYRQIPGLTNQ